MLSKFKKHIANQFSFLKEKKFLIACSGGVDSMVLVDLCRKLSFTFGIAHCNFNLRSDESNLDEEFVSKKAEEFEIPMYVQSFDTKTYAKENKLSIQMAARALRYQWFFKIASENGYSYVLTAHHLDDSLETFLINLSRGTGIEGLVGIPEVNDIFVRPLLPFTRNQIMEYATNNSIQWREDLSNASTKYLRNKIRHTIIPELKALHPQFSENFQTTLKNLKQTNQLLNNEIKRIKNSVFSDKGREGIQIDISRLLAYGAPEIYVYPLLKEYGFTAWNDMISILNAQPGKQLFSQTHRLVKDRNFLLLTPLVEKLDSEEYHIKENQEELIVPCFGTLKMKETSDWSRANKHTIYVDKDKLTYPLYVRKWKKGDYFCPIGMNGNKKKVSKFFKDEKLSILAKENVWILSSEDQIVWIIKYRADDRFKISPSSNNIIKLSIN